MRSASTTEWQSPPGPDLPPSTVKMKVGREGAQADDERLLDVAAQRPKPLGMDVCLRL